MKNFLQRIAVFWLLQFAVIGSVFADEAQTATQINVSIYEWILNNMLFIVAALVLIGAFYAIYDLGVKLFEVQKISLLKEQGLYQPETVDNKPDFFQELYKKMTKAVPVKKERDIMLDHDYDGIKELDNVLPPWWVATFYITIVWGIAYFGYFHFSDYGYTQEEEYAMNVKAAEKEVKAYLATKSDMVTEETVTLMTEATAVGIGGTIFSEKCISCHGAAGEGNSIGPNLTDRYWIHGGGIKNVFRTIKYGVPEKGMISWKSQLRPSDMQKVASYILSLQGTDPANAKAPQGELYMAKAEQEETEKTEDLK